MTDQTGRAMILLTTAEARRLFDQVVEPLIAEIT
jgi:hypothetical protein